MSNKQEPYKVFLSTIKDMKGDKALEQCWFAMQVVFKDLNDPKDTGWPKLRLAVQDSPDDEPIVYGE